MGVRAQLGQTITEGNKNRGAELVITLAVQVPFLDQLFYVGPLVSPLGGADISWIVGFGVASLLYLAGAKRLVHIQPGAAAAVGAAS